MNLLSPRTEARGVAMGKEKEGGGRERAESKREQENERVRKSARE